MHELALATELVEIIGSVAKENGVERVASAELLVGALTCVEPSALTFAFEVATQGTVAEGCTLHLQHVPLTVRCPHCGHEGPMGTDELACPACGGAGLEVTAGRELRLLSIDAEGAEDGAPQTRGDPDA